MWKFIAGFGTGIIATLAVETLTLLLDNDSASDVVLNDEIFLKHFRTVSAAEEPETVVVDDVER